MSFFSRSLYQDVARNWKGLCLPYLLCLVALYMIPAVMKDQADFAVFLNTEGREFAKQVPAITISKGTVSIDKTEPYFIRDEKTKDPIMIIDTTGGIRSLEGTKARVLLTKKLMLVKQDASDTKRFDLSGIDGFFIDRDILYNVMDTMEEWFAVMIYPFAVFFSFLYHFAEALLYAAIGLMLAHLLRISIGYRALIRLAVIAITPSLVLGIVLLVTDMTIPYWWVIRFWTSAAYLLYAIKANSGKEITQTS
jgi:hypothetical protein